MDDCSKDNSVELIQEWVKNNKVECSFVAHTQNQGVCRTFNEAIKLSKGKYISLIATDDTWLPDKISRQVEIMESMPEIVGVLYSDAYQIDEIGQRLPSMFIAEHRQFDAAPEGNILEQLIEDNFIPAMTTLIRRSVYDRVGLYDENLAFEDWDFWLRTARNFHFAYSQVPSANYRVVNSSLVRTLILVKNPAIYNTYVQINKKILSIPEISQNNKAITIARLSYYANELYSMGDPKAYRALLISFMANHLFSDLLSGMFALFGISHKNYQKTSSYIYWRFSQLQSIISSNKE
jgi:glycosyltransferase involved in cell wall biosynthesis